MSPTRDYYLPGHALVDGEQAEITEPPRLPRSTFHTRKNRLTTFNAGLLTPFYVMEVLPGDHVNLKATAYIRMATPLFPIYSNMNFETWAFFTPSRLVWTHWVNMMGEQANPTDSIAYTVPVINALTSANVTENSIWDHMGIPNQIAAGKSLSPNALPFRCYNLIYNYWFRDQNIYLSLPIDTGDGPDAITDYALQNVAKYHDYFTSCLPWPNKGDPSQTPVVPFQGFAPISGIGLGVPGAPDGTTYYTPENQAAFGGGTSTFARSGAVGPAYIPAAGQAIALHTDASGVPTTAADLSKSNPGGPTVGFTINSLRTAWAIQTLLERDARGGTRYIEMLRSQWGTINPDFRLQRPEYIGGGKMPLMVTPVAQTAPTTGATVGTLGAAATGMGTHRATYAATEHGYILFLLAARSELAYQQGLHKMYTRSTRYDFYVPALDGLGEQAVRTSELYATGDPTNDNVIFGYQERWHEYRTEYSDVTGQFRSTFSTPLDAWHLAQKFTPVAPLLNPTFINDSTPMSRILAAGGAADGQQFLADILIERTVTRVMRAYGTPAMLSHM